MHGIMRGRKTRFRREWKVYTPEILYTSKDTQTPRVSKRPPLDFQSIWGPLIPIGFRPSIPIGFWTPFLVISFNSNWQSIQSKSAIKCCVIMTTVSLTNWVSWQVDTWTESAINEWGGLCVCVGVSVCVCAGNARGKVTSSASYPLNVEVKQSVAVSCSDCQRSELSD